MRIYQSNGCSIRKIAGIIDGDQSKEARLWV
jgi:hypothetical protein